LSQQPRQQCSDTTFGGTATERNVVSHSFSHCVSTGRQFSALHIATGRSMVIRFRITSSHPCASRFRGVPGIQLDSALSVCTVSRKPGKESQIKSFYFGRLLRAWPRPPLCPPRPRLKQLPSNGLVPIPNVFHGSSGASERRASGIVIFVTKSGQVGLIQGGGVQHGTHSRGSRRKRAGATAEYPARPVPLNWKVDILTRS